MAKIITNKNNPLKVSHGNIADIVVLIRGAGEQASGVAQCLFRAGFKICLTEISEPLAVRRGVSFCEAVYEGEKEVEGIRACRVKHHEETDLIWKKEEIPIFIDPQNQIKNLLCPQVVIDATLAKKNQGTFISDAPLVIGMGPGFTAGKDVHIVIETQRGHNLGRLILDGEAEPNTGVPQPVHGFGRERVLRSPCNGIFNSIRDIGEMVSAGDIVAEVAGEPLFALVTGIVRGLIRNGIHVTKNLKVGDIDPKSDFLSCFTISDKARALGGAALEAILWKLPLYLSQ